MEAPARLSRTSQPPYAWIHWIFGEIATAKTIPLSLSLGILMVYLCLPSKSYFYDGIEYAAAIEASPGFSTLLIHPNHLLYNSAGYLAYRAVLALGWPVRAVDVLIALDSILSALSCFVFYQIALKILRSIYLSAALTLCLAFSATWWLFSTDAAPYIPSIFFLLISFYLLLPERKSRPILLAATHSMGMLLHQLAFWFWPVAIAGLLFQSASQTVRRRCFTALQYALTASAVVGSAYYAAFVLQHGAFQFGVFSRWLTSYSSEAHFSFHTWRNLFFSLQGNIRLFFGGRLSLVPIDIFTITSGLLFVCCFSLLVATLFRQRANLDLSCYRTPRCRQCGPLTLMALVWLGTYLVFLFFWLPYNTYYRLFYFPAILLFGASALGLIRDLEPDSWKRPALLLASVIATCNLTFCIYPYSREEANRPLTSALTMNPVWPKGTVVYYHVFNTDDWTLKYFNPQTVWRELKEEDLPQFEHEMLKTCERGTRVWVETTAIDVLKSQRGPWFQAHTKAATNYQWNSRRARIQLSEIHLATCHD